MNSNPTLNELLRELDSVSKKLVQAKKDFLAAEATYENRGSKLETVIVNRVEEYIAGDRARLLREAAQNLRADIKKFTELRINIMNEVGFLLMQLNLTAAGLAIEAWSWPEPVEVTSNDPRETIRSFVRTLDRKQAQLLLVAARSIEAGRNVVSALEVAKSLILIRQAGFELYLEETLTVNIEAALDAAEDIMAAALREEIYKAVLEAGAEALGVAVATVFPIVKIVTIGHELHSKLQKMKDRYKKRESADELLDLWDHVNLENEAIEKDLLLFASVREAMAKDVPS